MLSTDTESGKDDPSQKDVSSFNHSLLFTNTGPQKVTIATCHAAKGLEWPVVFIPAGTLI